MRAPEKRHSLAQRGFTLIEMLVVILIVVVLIAIVLAVGEQVRVKAKLAVTHTELRNLQAALLKFHHKTNSYPTDMPGFLVAYQRLHAYAIPGASPVVWHEHDNILTQFPSATTVMGTFAPPGGTGTPMTGVVEILDGFGNPIQYMPPTQPAPSVAFYPLSGKPYSGYSVTVTPTPIQATEAVTVPSGITTVSTPPNGAVPTAVPHAPYFYSFGADGPAAALANINAPTAQYIYSYEP